MKDELIKVAELRKINEFRNQIDKDFYRKGSPEVALDKLKNLIVKYGKITYPVKPFSFELYLNNETIIIERGGKKITVDEADSVSTLELLETFKNDLILC